VGIFRLCRLRWAGERRCLSEVYLKADPHYTGRVTARRWDKLLSTNESPVHPGCWWVCCFIRQMWTSIGRFTADIDKTIDAILSADQQWRLPDGICQLSGSHEAWYLNYSKHWIDRKKCCWKHSAMRHSSLKQTGWRLQRFCVLIHLLRVVLGCGAPRFDHWSVGTSRISIGNRGGRRDAVITSMALLSCNNRLRCRTWWYPDTPHNRHRLLVSDSSHVLTSRSVHAITWWAFDFSIIFLKRLVMLNGWKVAALSDFVTY